MYKGLLRKWIVSTQGGNQLKNEFSLNRETTQVEDEWSPIKEHPKW
jgi:hypothetical protein